MPFRVITWHVLRKDAKTDMIDEKVSEMVFLYHFPLRMIGVFCVIEEKSVKKQ